MPEAQEDAAKGKLHFDLIDPLRGFAALTILVYHAIAHFGWQSFPAHSVFLWFHWGWMAVDIFFIISGFVITLSALQLRKKYQRIEFLRTFMKRRLLRIAPLYYLTLVIFMLLYMSWAEITPGNVISHLFFLHTWSFVYFGAINGPNWSVGTEVQFYVLLALIIPFINYKNILKIILSFMVITWLWRLGSFMAYGGAADQTFILFTKTVQVPGMLDEFVFGIAVAFFVTSDKFHVISSTLWFRLAVCVAIAIIALIAISIYMHFATFWDNIYMVVFFRTLIAMLFALFILLLCCLKPGKYVLTLLRPTIYLGTISYGIYLFHLPVMLKVKELNMANSAKLLLTFIITLILASLSWHFFEKRFLSLK